MDNNDNRFTSRKFLGVAVWTFFWAVVLLKGVFGSLPSEGWTFLSASLTPITAGIWGAYMGINVWEKKVNGKK